MLSVICDMAKKEIFFLLLTFSFMVKSVYLTSPKPQTNCSFEAMAGVLHCSVSLLDNISQVVELSSEHKIRIGCFIDSEASSLQSKSFGYLPNLDELEIEFCRLRLLTPLAFSGLSGLKRLKLDSIMKEPRIEWPSELHIDEDAFIGLTNLRELNFTGNNIKVLPQRAFCSLDSLRSLNLKWNGLSEISQTNFQSSQNHDLCLASLISLDLSFNNITTLYSSGFVELRQLQSLNISHNNLKFMDEFSLEGLVLLSSLDVSNNLLKHIPSGVFDHLKQLTQLYLGHNLIKLLAPEQFVSLRYLEFLDLSYNEGLEIVGNTFDPLVRLIYLDLSHNNLRRIERNVFASLNVLQVLDLGHNSLQYINENHFKMLQNIYSLTLSYNKIKNIERQGLSGMTVLVNLALDHNKLEDLPEDLFQNCTNLESLNLSHNMFVSVPPLDFGRHLRSLDISHNNLEKISGGILSWNLNRLSLASNKIVNITKAKIQNGSSSLEQLDLSDNNIEMLAQGIFNSLTHLKVLRLDRNKLKDINGLLAGQTALIVLNVSDNHLQWFDFAFISKNLEILDVSDNNIDELGNYYKLSEGLNLRVLDASFNRIEYLEQISLPLPNIERLILNNNRITSIGARTFDLKPNLRLVKLQLNRIEHLNFADLAVSFNDKNSSNQRPEFFLGSNPFVCDCKLEWLQKINNRNSYFPLVSSSSSSSFSLVSPFIRDIDMLRCMLNNDITESKSLALLEVNSDQFLCRYKTHCYTLCKCCDFFACDCRMQCPSSCTCFHDSTWTINIIQCSQNKHQKIPMLIPMDATNIRLDGNNFEGLLESQAFIGRKRVVSLYLNNSYIEAIHNQTFNGLHQLEVLYLDHNLIQKIHGYEFNNLIALKELWLQHNRIEKIFYGAFKQLVSLQILRIEGNLLKTLFIFNDTLAPSITSLYISNNPFRCECELQHKFRSYVEKYPKLINDIQHVGCFKDGDVSKTWLILRSSQEICQDKSLGIQSQTNKSVGSPSTMMISLIIGIILFCFIVIVIVAIFYLFRQPFKLWIYSKYGLRVELNTHIGNKKFKDDKLYDAFLSYATKDEHFVSQILARNLESRYKLCLQHRDLPPHTLISEAFAEINRLCAKVILIVSRAYLESEWIKIKFVLLKATANDWKPLIVVLEEPSTLDLAAIPEFNLLFNSSPIVRWNDANFMNKLRFFLPETLPTNAKTRRKKDENTEYGVAKTYNINYDIESPFRVSGWHYDGALGTNNSSSTSTRSTVTGEGGGSPLFLQTKRPQNSCFENSGGGHYYTIKDSIETDHIYHTLEPGTVEPVSGQYDAVGNLNVMLPTGQLVPATLVRNTSGNVVTLVDVSHAANETGRTLTINPMGQKCSNRVHMV